MLFVSVNMLLVNLQADCRDMQLEESEYYAGIVDKGTLDAIASGGNKEHVSNEHIMSEDD